MPPTARTSPEAVLKIASELADAEGLRGVGVRAIANRLGISPGTLYNVVGDIDDIILRVNEQVLIGLRIALEASVVPGEDPMRNILKAATAYIDYVLANPKRWSMLIEYSLGSDKQLPRWYRTSLDATIGTVDSLLQPLISARRERQRAVTILWAALEGLSSLSASDKLSLVSDEDPRVLVKLLISQFLAQYQTSNSESSKSAPQRPAVRVAARRK
jgi:AcrR family transcriptional regulator